MYSFRTHCQGSTHLAAVNSCRKSRKWKTKGIVFVRSQENVPIHCRNDTAGSLDHRTVSDSALQKERSKFDNLHDSMVEDDQFQLNTLLNVDDSADKILSCSIKTEMMDTEMENDPESEFFNETTNSNLLIHTVDDSEKLAAVNIPETTNIFHGIIETEPVKSEMMKDLLGEIFDQKINDSVIHHSSDFDSDDDKVGIFGCDKPINKIPGITYNYADFPDFISAMQSIQFRCESCRINFQNDRGLHEHNQEYHQSQIRRSSPTTSAKFPSTSQYPEHIHSLASPTKSHVSKYSYKRKPCICGIVHRSKPDCRGPTVKAGQTMKRLQMAYAGNPVRPLRSKAYDGLENSVNFKDSNSTTLNLHDKFSVETDNVNSPKNKELESQNTEESFRDTSRCPLCPRTLKTSRMLHHLRSHGLDEETCQVYAKKYRKQPTLISSLDSEHKLGGDNYSVFNYIVDKTSQNHCQLYNAC